MRPWGQVLPFASPRPALCPISRRLRIGFPGAIYHITSCGGRREPIYRDGDDVKSRLVIDLLDE